MYVMLRRMYESLYAYLYSALSPEEMQILFVA